MALRSILSLVLGAAMVATVSCRKSDARKGAREPLTTKAVKTARAQLKPMDRAAPMKPVSDRPSSTLR